MTTENKTYTWKINKQGIVVDVCDSWRTFARENDAQDLASNVIGTLWSSHISVQTTVMLYKELIKKVAESNSPIDVNFRCDSPRLKRYMKLHIAPDKDGLIEFSSMLIEEKEQSIKNFAANSNAAKGLIIICSWCKKINYPPRQWVELEQAIQFHNLMQKPNLPALTHGICPTCKAEVVKKIKGA